MPEPIPTASDLIAESLAGPASASVDGRSAEAHPLPDQIEAAKYLESRKALEGRNKNGGPRSGWGATRPARFIPPGGV